jgi:hypothetical protein
VVETVLEALAADESVRAAGVEVIEAEAELLVEPPRPRSSPREDRPEPTTPRRPPLEEDAAVVETVVEALETEESVAGCCWLVVSASVEGTSEFFWTLLPVLDPSVFLVVVVVVAVGSPPMVVVPVIRWVISGFLGSTEMVTTTTSSPFWD